MNQHREVMDDLPLPHMLVDVGGSDRPREAAFFDLDKTLISRAALVAFAPVLQRAGLVSRRLIVKAVWMNLVFRLSAVSERDMQSFRRQGLAIVEGWDSATVAALVRANVGMVTPPILYPGANALIAAHRDAGRLLFLVSAGPEDVVIPMAEFLGMHAVIASRAHKDDTGRYTGESEFWAYGPAKARAMRAAADHLAIDLTRSWAYSDSATDLPMLQAVGHAVATNPDAKLATIARDEGWEELRLDSGMSSRRAHAVMVKELGTAVALAGFGSLARRRA